MRFTETLGKKARKLQEQSMQLAFALTHPKVAFPVKMMIIMTLAYVLSPIDLIPDFIPVLGILDDILIVSVNLWLIMKLIPHDVRKELSKQSHDVPEHLQQLGRWGSGIIIALWVVLTVTAWRLYSQ